MKKQSLIGKPSVYILLVFGLILTIGPLYWMVVGATNPSGKIFGIPPKFLPGSHLMENYKNLQEAIGIGRVLWNSLFITITYTILSLFICSIAGYAFAKFRFKGRETIFFAFLLAMMIPYQVMVIPLFKMFASVGMLNTYAAVILPQLSYPFAIFLMRQNMKSLPDSLIEAARADGAGEFHIFFRIALPTMMPSLAAVAIFLFTFQWNNFMWPLIALNSQDMYTLPVALSSIVGQREIDYGQLMLGTTISILPVMVFFLFLQKHFVSGILGGAVKE